MARPVLFVNIFGVCGCAEKFGYDARVPMKRGINNPDPSGERFALGAQKTPTHGAGCPQTPATFPSKTTASSAT